MPSVVVSRFGGDVHGAPITEPLAAEEVALIARGRKEIDDRALDTVERTITIPLNNAVRTGMVVRVHTTGGRVQNLKVTGTRTAKDGLAVVTVLTLRGVIL
ncbi:hypothetical protein [Vibrio phage LV6]|nr:hypothetical protein [Vibrio phage LV6]